MPEQEETKRCLESSKPLMDWNCNRSQACRQTVGLFVSPTPKRKGPRGAVRPRQRTAVTRSTAPIILVVGDADGVPKLSRRGGASVALEP